MRTTAEFQVHRAHIKFDRYNEPIHIYPFGDVHYNSANCDRDKFHEWCDARRKERNSYFIGMGDYLDTLSSSERSCFSNAALHDQSVDRVERAFIDDTKEFANTISFMKGRLLGLIGGNHYYKLSSGMTTDHLLCQYLGCKFLGTNAILKIILERDQHHHNLLKFILHHGDNGGRTCGSSINKLQVMANSFTGDALLMGHDHNRAVDYINRLDTTDNRSGEDILINRRMLLARTGSFLKGYEKGKSSYIVDANLPPSDLGTICITLIPKRVHERNVDGRGKIVDKRIVDMFATL